MIRLDHSRIKWMWTGIALCGVVISYSNWHNARNDLRVVRTLSNFRKDGPRDIIATRHEERDFIRLIGHTCNFVGGVISIILPPGNLQRILTVSSLIAQSISLLINGWRDRQARHRVITMPDHKYQREDV